MHIYEQDYLRLLNRCEGTDLQRHLSVDKVGCIEMHITIITEDNVETEAFYGMRIWYYAFSIIVSQYYLFSVPAIKDWEVFKVITAAHLKALVCNPNKKEIEDYIENRKQLIREIELYERQRAQEQRKGR